MMQCQICRDVCHRGYDARELAELLGIRNKCDLGRYIVCEDCYNDIERAVASAFLRKVEDDGKPN